MSALDLEFKPSKKPLSRVLNFNKLLRTKQLQRRRNGQLLLIATYLTIVLLGSVPYPSQKPNLISRLVQ